MTLRPSLLDFWILGKQGKQQLENIYLIIIEFFNKSPENLKQFITELFDIIKTRWEEAKYIKSEFGKSFAEFWDELGVSIQLAKDYAPSAITTNGVIIKGDPLYQIIYQSKIVWEGGNDAIKKFYGELKQLPKKARKKRLEELNRIARIRKILDDYVKLRAKYLKEYDNLSTLNQAWRKRITIKELKRSELKNIYLKYIKKHNDLDGKNFAEFNTKIFKDGKLINTVYEFSHSGKRKIADTIDGRKVINKIDDKSFKKVKDLDNIPRGNDSEIKYIYNFLKSHIDKGDFFVIETTNIFTACSSCRRELLVLKELLGNKVKIVVKAKEMITNTKDLKKYLDLD